MTVARPGHMSTLVWWSPFLSSSTISCRRAVLLQNRQQRTYGCQQVFRLFLFRFSARVGCAIANGGSVRPSVCLSVTLVNRGSRLNGWRF